MSSERDALCDALAEPFEPDEVCFKPQSVSGNRALAIAYVTARAVMDRLDEVVGVANWKDHYEVLPDGNVKCTLSLRVGSEWVSKEDVGGPSEQPDDGDKCKAAFSDALKRVAVKWGIARYLYRLPKQRADYDPKTRQFVRPPALPEWARPKAKPSALPAARRAETPEEKVQGLEQRWAGEGWCRMGDLFEHLDARLGPEWREDGEVSSDDIRHEIQEFQRERKNGKAAAR